MAEEKKSDGRCIVIVCTGDSDADCVKIVKCDSEEAEEMLAKLKDLCGTASDCCD